jgi:chromosome segregation ATPase
MADQSLDIDALIQALQNNPEARQRLLAALLPQEFLALPFQVAQLARTVAEHNERIERLERAVQQLADTIAQLVGVVQGIVQELAELRETVNGLIRGQEELRETVNGLIRGQEELRASVAELRETVNGLIRGQEELRASVAELRETVNGLIRGQEELRASVAELRETVNGLIRGQEELRASVAELRETMEGLAKAVERLIEWQVLAEQRFQRIEDRLGQLIGWRLEEEYAKHAYAYFGTYLRKIRRADMEEIFEKATHKLSITEAKDLSRADLILKGQLRFADQREVYLVMEVAATLDVNDVTRASRRADLLSRAGFPSIPVVGGEKMAPAVEDSARELDVAIALDGGLMGWEAAFRKRLRMTS